MGKNRIVCFILSFVMLFQAPFVAVAQSRLGNNRNNQQLLQNLSSQGLPSSLSSNPEALMQLSGGNFDLSGLSPQLASMNVHVVGDVQNVGTYKIPVGTRLSTILQNAQPKRTTFRFIKIEREGKSSVYDYYRFIYSGSLENNPYLQENDVVHVLGFAKAVRVGGPVSRPGVYEIGSAEKTVSDVILLAGGLTSVYNPKSPIKIIRVGADDEKSVIEIESGQIKNTKIKPNDTIVVSSLVTQNTEFDYSQESLPGEEPFYPTANPEIYIGGAVLAPGKYAFKPHMTIKDYIGEAGVNTAAKLRNPKIIRKDKKLTAKMTDRPMPGDMIVVGKQDLTTFTTVLGVVSSILSVTLTTILLNDRLKE